jgi:hypothetical protein
LRLYHAAIKALFEGDRQSIKGVYRQAIKAHAAIATSRATLEY